MGSHIPCINENGVQVTGIFEVNRSLKGSPFQGIIPINPHQSVTDQVFPSRGGEPTP